MAKKAAVSEWNTWETLPEDGALIIVKTADGRDFDAQFDSESWAGQGGWNDGDVWKLKPADAVSNGTKPATTEPDKTKSKRFSLNISDEDLHRYISDGLKSDSGVTVENMWTNADGGFIVYGYGLGKVQS